MTQYNSYARLNPAIVTIFSTLFATAFIFGCQTAEKQPISKTEELSLGGSWRGKVQFTDGPYAPIKDLEFMYQFNPGGTMLESSNYDAAPPVPPAYGIWRKIGERQFEARYEFYMTRFPEPNEHQPTSAGWLPAGRGILLDTISLSADGRTFTSKTHLTMIGMNQSSSDGGGASGNATKIEF